MPLSAEEAFGNIAKDMDFLVSCHNTHRHDLFVRQEREREAQRTLQEKELKDLRLQTRKDPELNRHLLRLDLLVDSLSPGDPNIGEIKVHRGGRWHRARYSYPTYVVQWEGEPEERVESRQAAVRRVATTALIVGEMTVTVARKTVADNGRRRADSCRPWLGGLWGAVSRPALRGYALPDEDGVTGAFAPSEIMCYF